jgi:predicted ATPase/DNA-binding winged helix-turn-helix (wHTH) protein
MLYRFGRFELRADDRTLFEDGLSLAMSGRAVDLLRVLVEHRSRKVTSDELLRLAWPRLAVGEGALEDEIAQLRRILGADAITGGGGRGYRLHIELEGETAMAGRQVGEAAPQAQGRRGDEHVGTGTTLPHPERKSVPRPPLAPERSAQLALRFDRFEIRPERRQVLVGGAPAKLGARALDILLLLVEHRDRVVSRAEIFEQVWPRSVVVEGNLQVHIFALRKLLGARTIATIPGRGYRFTADLEEESGPPVARTLLPSAPEGHPSVTPVLQFKSHLPEALDDLFGRDTDLAEVRALVSQHRQVTITGPGGIGKTRLAQRLAVEQRSAYPNGVCWVDLSSVTDPKLVPSAIGSDLGVQLAHGEQVEALAQVLKDAHALIVLDNAEHLIDAVAITAAKLLDQTLAARLLVTSQVPLRGSREVQYRLGAMAVPDEDDLTPDEAMTYGAIQLFAARARAVDRHFTLDGHTMNAAIDICRRLDAIPLAIELAAARVGTIGLAKLAESLDERLRLLTGGARDAPRRQQTLLATMQWSHSLLRPQEKVVFQRLGIFRSGFGLELAQSVAADAESAIGGQVGDVPGDEAMDGWAVLDHMGTLVDHSLVAMDPGDCPRYRLLETARLFALESLHASGETSVVTRRFVEAIHARFVRQEEGIWSGRTAVDSAIAALEPDLPNFREALQWAIDNDAELAVGLASTLEHAVTGGRMDEMLAMFDATEPLAQTVGEPLRARWALAYARNLNSERGLKARHWAGCAFDIYSRLGLRERRHLALASKLMCELAGGLPVNESEWSSLVEGEDRDWSDCVKSVRPRAVALRSYYAGDFQAATSAGRELLQMAERCGSGLLIKTTQLDLAEFARSMGRLDESMRVLAELVEIINPVQERNLAALAWINLFGTRLAAGKLADAREAARRASEHCTIAQVQHWWADGAAFLAALEGRPRAATRLIGYADAIYSARSFIRQPNELEFRQSAATASQLHLSAEQFRQLLGSGARLSDEAAIGIGLGIVDF